MTDQTFCGNPLYLSFVEKWHRQAEKSDNPHIRGVYRNAVDSLKRCPEIFDHPSRTLQLKGIGPKIAKKLLDEINKYRRERGEEPLPLAPAPIAQEEVVVAPTRKKKTTKAKETNDENMPPITTTKKPKGKKAIADDGTAPAPVRRKRKSKDNNVIDVDASSEGGGDEAEDEDAAAPAPAPAPKKRRQAAKPKQYIPQPRSGGYAIIRALVDLDEYEALTKDELVRRAQPYCDSSFTVSSNAATSHMTGSKSHYTAWNSMATLKNKGLIVQNGRPVKFGLSEEGREVGERILEVEEVMGEPEAAESTRAVRGLTGVDKNSTREVWTDISEGPTVSSASAVGRAFGRINSEVESATVIESAISGPTRSAFSRTTSSVGERSTLPLSTLSGNTLDGPTKKAFSRTNSAAQSSTSNAVSRLKSPEAPAEPTIDIRAPFSLKKLKAGTFTIHLILDNREVATKTDRDYIQRQLDDVNCTPVTRALDIGDFMWIARGKLVNDADESIPDEEEVEVTLDHVGERKRLDDLVGSIKDGRFHEQKFRLGRLIKNVTYIIETSSIPQAHQMADAITTAIFSTQVFNKFFVKLSPKVDDTIRYLARYTRLLQSLFEGKDLYIVPADRVAPDTYKELQTHLASKYDDKEFFLTYASFASLASKSKTLTVRDVFLKMLMCTRGVSAEKALEIQRSFATPRHLVEALEKYSDNEKEGRRVIMNTVDPGAVTDRRKVKSALSSKLWDVWGPKKE